MDSRLSPDRPPGAPQRVVQLDRPDQRARGRGQHGAGPGDQPARRPQVPEVRVPHRGGGVPRVRRGEAAEDERAGDGEPHDDRRAGERHRDAEPRGRAPSVRGQDQQRGRGGEGEQAGQHGDGPDRPQQVAAGDVQMAVQQRDRLTRADLPRPLRLQHSQRLCHHDAGIGDGERDRVLVAPEHPGVQVGHGAPEQARERLRADDRGHDRGHRRAHRQQVGMAADQLAGDPVGHRAAQPGVLQRGGGAAGELARVEQGPPRVAGHCSHEQQQRRDHRQHPDRQPAHRASLPGRSPGQDDAASPGSRRRCAHVAGGA